MTFECKCVDDEQRKLLLQAVGALVVSHRKDIDIWSEPEFKEHKDVVIPYFREKIVKLEDLEKKIKGVVHRHFGY